MPRGEDGYADISGVAKGAYVLKDFGDGEGDIVILIGTGSEVQYAVGAAEKLAEEGISGPRGLDAVP